IIFSMNDYALTQTVRIEERANNLEKVDSINNLSRRISDGLPLKKAIKQLENIHEARMFPFWLVVLSGGIIGVMFLYLFEGVLIDGPAAFVGGSSVVLILEGILPYTKLNFFIEFFAALCTGIVRVLYVGAGPGQMLDTIVIASVMPLVPGVLITNAIREMIRGHLLACIVTCAVVALTSFGIGAGVGHVFVLSYVGDYLYRFIH